MKLSNVSPNKLFYFLFLLNQSTYGKKFKVGIVMVDKTLLNYPFENDKVQPAIDMAMEYSKREYNIEFEK